MSPWCGRGRIALPDNPPMTTASSILLAHQLEKLVADLRSAGGQLAHVRDIPELARRVRHKPSIPAWLRQVSQAKSASGDFDLKASRVAEDLIKDRLARLRDADPASFQDLRGRLLQDLRLLGPDLARERIAAEREISKIARDFAAGPSEEGESRPSVLRPPSGG